MPRSLLFSPIQIGNLTLKNRIVISPMCQCSAEDGFANDWHLVHLGARAIGGAGIVMMEATAVEPIGRISPNCAGIWKAEHISQLKRIVEFIKSQNSIPAIQLAHAGRKAVTYPPWISFTKHVPTEEGGWQGVGPSALAFDPDNDPVPKAASLADIQRIKSAFVAATTRAIEAGFQIIELHFAHGYLVQSFLSPYSNKRTDQYGGPFENRIRLAVEIVQMVKLVIPQDFPLFVRLSCEEFAPDGEPSWDMSQTIELARILKQLGVHLVDCSSGGNVVRAKLPMLNYNLVDQVSMAEAVQREAGIATGAVGGIVTAEWAEKILQKNKATLIFIARASMDDPNWPIHAAIELGDEQHRMPNQYAFSLRPIKGFGAWRESVLAKQNRKQLKQN